VSLAPAVEARVIGRLEVLVGGRPADPGPPKQRLLLAALLARANRVVSVDQLTDVLWDADAPRTARKNIHVYVSGLRKLLGARIAYSGDGYMCRIGPEECDLLRFGQLTAAGRRAARGGDRETASRMLGAAVRLWRDRAFADLVGSAWLAAESDRIQDRFLAAYEDWIELEIELGRHLEALESLDDLAARFPARERLSVCRMTALARCGRTAEALAHFDRLRQSLARDLGIEPSAVLRDLYRRLLAGAGTAAAGPAAGAPAGVHQLPRRIADFVGRGAELDLLLDPRAEVTVISGRVGTGKTALAVQAGHLLRECYPDGELFLRLRDAQGLPVPPAESLRAALRAAGLASCLPAEAAGVFPVWQSWLSDRRMVLLVDNAPDEACVNALLPGSDACRVVVTSHRRLSGLSCAQRITLRDFDQAEALELLGRILGPGRMRGGQAALRRLLAVCGTSPQTVRLLGNRLSTLAHVPLADFADRLDAARDPLGELATGDSSLRDGFEHWFRDLPQLHRQALLRLARLPESVFSYDEAVRVLTGLGRRPDLVVESLIEANILAAPSYEASSHTVLFDIPRPVLEFLPRRREPARRLAASGHCAPKQTPDPHGARSTPVPGTAVRPAE
jgi:DNA-binding SARP family transcriptional activator